MRKYLLSSYLSRTLFHQLDLFRAYPWLLDFINTRSARQTRNLSVNTAISQTESGRTAMKISYLPGHGQHFFVHNYRYDNDKNKSPINYASLSLCK